MREDTKHNTRTNIVINNQLIRQIMKFTGIKTKKQVVEEGLKLMARLYKQSEIKKYRGELKWTGNLSKMRGQA